MNVYLMEKLSTSDTYHGEKTPRRIVKTYAVALETLKTTDDLCEFQTLESAIEALLPFQNHKLILGAHPLMQRRRITPRLERVSVPQKEYDKLKRSEEMYRAPSGHDAEKIRRSGLTYTQTLR